MEGVGNGLEFVKKRKKNKLQHRKEGKERKGGETTKGWASWYKRSQNTCFSARRRNLGVSTVCLWGGGWGCSRKEDRDHLGAKHWWRKKTAVDQKKKKTTKKKG